MNIIHALVFISCAVVSVSSMRCYWCNSQNDQQCGDNFQSGNIKIEDNCQYCVTFTLPGNDVIVRNCTKERLDYKSGCTTRDSIEMCACLEDLCNGAVKSSTFSMAVLTYMSMYCLYMFC